MKVFRITANGACHEYESARMCMPASAARLEPTELREALTSGAPLRAQDALFALSPPLSGAEESTLVDVLDQVEPDSFLAGSLAHALGMGSTGRSLSVLYAKVEWLVSRRRFRRALSPATAMAARRDTRGITTLIGAASSMSDLELETTMRLLPMRESAALWPEADLARVQASNAPLAQLTVMSVLVARGDERGYELCTDFVDRYAPTEDETPERFMVLAAIAHVPNVEMQRQLAMRAYRKSRSPSVRLDCAALPAFPSGPRVTIIRASTTHENPVYRYRAAELLGLVSRKTSRAIAREWLAREPDDVVRAAIAKNIAPP